MFVKICSKLMFALCSQYTFDREAKPEHSCNIIQTFAEYKTEEKRDGPHRSFKNS